MAFPPIPKLVWWAILIVPTALWMRQSMIKETNTLPDKIVAIHFFGRVTFNFEGATNDSYAVFLKSLREKLKGKEVHGLPVTRKTVKPTERYVLAELKIHEGSSLTLAIDVTDLYIVASLDSYKGQNRTNFLADAPQVSRDNLVYQNRNVRNISFNSSYIDLERKAKKTRQDVELGVYKLACAVESVYGKIPDTSIEAKFFIIAIEMVSEATRFRYIQRLVVENETYGSHKLDSKALVLENNWDTISKVIHKSNSTEIIDPPLVLCINCTEWIINDVEDIKPDIGILKFKEETQASQFSQVM